MSIDPHYGGAKAIKVKIRARQSPPKPTSSPLQQVLWWFRKASLADGCLAAMTGHRVITQIQRTELADRRQRHAAANSRVLVLVSLWSLARGFWLLGETWWAVWSHLGRMGHRRHCLTPRKPGTLSHLVPRGYAAFQKAVLPGVVKHSRNGIQVSSTKQCMASIGRNSTTTTTFVGRESSGDYAQLGKIVDLSQLTTSSVCLAKGAHTCNKEASQGVGCCQPAGMSTCPAVV
ncbi:hypothetical protein ACSS6W_005280 [Trichoderma asperelloides]